MKDKKPWAVSAIEAVFGLFRGNDAVETNHRRCWKCWRRYDMRKVNSPNRMRFCSQECSAVVTHTNVATRQQRFHEFRNYYFAATKKKYGSGVYSWAEGMNRRSGRLVARKVARRAMREQPQ